MRLASRLDGHRAAVVVVAVVAVAALASALLGLDAPALAPPRDDAGPPAGTADASTAIATPQLELGALEALPAPEPGAFPGRLVVLRNGCAGIAVVPMARPTPPASFSGPCTGLLSASGARVVSVLEDNGRYQFAGFLLGVAAPGGTAVDTGVRAGVATAGEPAVSDAGAVATCDERSTGARSTTLWRDGRERRVRGCWPAFDGERLLLGRLRPRPAVVGGDGEVVLDLGTRPRAPLGRVVAATAPAAGSTGPVLAVVHDTARGDADALVVPVGGGAPIIDDAGVAGGIITSLRVAPGGRALAIESGGAWSVVAWDADGARRTADAVAGRRILGAAFAPDGSAAAVATRDGVVIVALPDLRPVAALPGAARDVAWAGA